MKLVYFNDFKVGVIKGENVVDVTSVVSSLPASGAREPMIALIENSGFGGHHAAPAVRKVYDVYYRKTRNAEPPGAVPVAKSRKPVEVTTGD